jgi:hypothetical protein
MKKLALPGDLEAMPSLDAILPVRAERIAVARQVMAELSDDALTGTIRVRGPGYPRAGTYNVLRCVQTLINEEWHHRQYAERDLDVLATAQTGTSRTRRR